ncbi:MAG: hypothetical protein ACKVOE_02430 [Rickettsiales bacterium]
MHRSLRYFLAGLCACAPVFAAAQSAVPLAIVRFNQPQVYYEQQLYGALTKAVSVKPDLLFDVVAYSPLTGKPEVDAAWAQQTSQHAQAVVISLQQMGVPVSRISVTSQSQPGIRFDETHIYVH